MLQRKKNISVEVYVIDIPDISSGLDLTLKIDLSPKVLIAKCLFP